MSAFLVDTSFLITLVDDSRPHHADAMRYLREAVARSATLYLSTVVVAEFHAKQAVTDLPLRNLRVLPFNIDHAMMAGELASALRRDALDPRDAVKDDLKLLAQAVCTSIPYILTEDEKTLAKFARQLELAGRSSVKTVLLRDGFELAWFNNGQRGFPGT
ncbi:MAG: PIN domain-containing protein [Rubrivivax sp.]|nr:PIN domain-containing protein [Rubrivivax sp.]